MKRLCGISILTAALSLSPSLARAEHLFAFCYDIVPHGNHTTYVFSKVFPYEGTFESMKSDNDRIRPQFDSFVVSNYAPTGRTGPACRMNLDEEAGANASRDEQVKIFSGSGDVVMSDWSPN